jgi:hypothetical protein
MDPAMMGGDPLQLLLDRVDAIGFMLLKITEALNIPLEDPARAPAAEAADQMAPGMSQEVAAQEAAAAEAANPLSEQAEDALQGAQPGMV